MPIPLRSRRPVPSELRAALDLAMGMDSAAVSATAVSDDATAAPLVVTLPPSAFSATWKGKPTDPQRIGLRLVSDEDNDRARANATSSADRFYSPEARSSDAYIEHWNNELIRSLLAVAMCQPNNVAAPWFKDMAALKIGAALTEKGILRLWQGYAELQERLSPLLRVAEREDLMDLSTRLAEADAIGRIHVGDLRLLARILDDLRAQA